MPELSELSQRLVQRHYDKAARESHARMVAATKAELRGDDESRDTHKEKLRRRKRGIKLSGKRLKQESTYDTITELSKGLIKRYASSAADDHLKQSHRKLMTGDHDAGVRATKRRRGIAMANRRLKEDADTIVSLSALTAPALAAMGYSTKKIKDIMAKKLKKEEADELAELGPIAAVASGAARLGGSSLGRGLASGAARGAANRITKRRDERKTMYQHRTGGPA